MVCANYTICHFKLDKLIQDQFFVEMNQASMLRGNVKNNTGQFPILWNNFKENTDSPLVDLTPDEHKILQGSYLCTSGLLFLLQRSKDYWTHIINDAMDYGSAWPHGNFGKKRGIVNSMEVFQPLKDFFQMLEGRCEVWVTYHCRSQKQYRGCE